MTAARHASHLDPSAPLFTVLRKDLPGSGRLSDISEGRLATEDTAEVLRQLTDFLVAGIAASAS